jgi:hypothetical protein
MTEEKLWKLLLETLDLAETMAMFACEEICITGDHPTNQHEPRLAEIRAEVERGRSS